MKKVLILTAAVLMIASMAFAQGGRIALYADAEWTDCNLVPTLFVSNSIYIVHELAPTANTSQFAVQDNVVSSGAWLHAGVAWNNNLQLGEVYTGITVTYVGCKNLPYLIGTLSIIPTSDPGVCAGDAGVAMEVVADPHLPSGNIEVVDCNGTDVWVADGGKLSVNDDGSCPCLVPDATKETTWSNIKALYK